MLFSDWVVNSHDEEDFGYDFEIRPTQKDDEGFFEVSPQNFYLQLKASQVFEDEDGASINIEVNTLLDDWLNASVPVVLAVYERDSDTFYWCIVQQYCWDVLDKNNSEWRDQKYVNIDISQHRELSSRHILLSKLSSTQERIAFRQHISSLADSESTRPWTFEVESASTEEITEYKIDTIESARRLIDENHVSKGVSELVKVYQMPEEDEGKLEAIITLLGAREIDHPVIALAQNGRGESPYGA